MRLPSEFLHAKFIGRNAQNRTFAQTLASNVYLEHNLYYGLAPVHSTRSMRCALPIFFQSLRSSEQNEDVKNNNSKGMGADLTEVPHYTAAFLETLHQWFSNSVLGMLVFVPTTIAISEL